MKRISLSSLGILVIFIIAYFENALNTQFMHEIKMIFACMFLIWLLSTAYWIFESIQRKEKVQTKLGKV
jgi:hypothetical protein